MAGSTVRQLQQLFFILPGRFTIAIQAPTHIEDLGILGNCDQGHVTVAVLAVLPGSHVGAVVELDKIRHNGHRHPLYGSSAFDRLLQRRQQCAGLRFGNLLMAPPALGLGGNARLRTSGCSGMAVQALNPKTHMRSMGELNGLYRRLLGEIYPIRREAEDRQQHDSHCDQTERLPQPVKKSLEHGCSREKH